jgi:hypothetical protein
MPKIFWFLVNIIILCKLPKLYISNGRNIFEKASYLLGQDLNSQLLDCEAGLLFTQ